MQLYLCLFYIIFFSICFQKAFLRLKKDVYDEKIKFKLKCLEDEFSNKTKLYSGVPEQTERLVAEFRSNSADLLRQRENTEV